MTNVSAVQKSFPGTILGFPKTLFLTVHLRSFTDSKLISPFPRISQGKVRPPSCPTPPWWARGKGTQAPSRDPPSTLPPPAPVGPSLPAMGSISVAQVKAPQVGFTAVDGTESRSYMKIWPKPLAGSDPEAGLEPEAPRRVGGNSQAGRDARRGLSCAGRKPSGRRRWRRTAVAPARAAGAARARGRCPQSR